MKKKKIEKQRHPHVQYVWNLHKTSRFVDRRKKENKRACRKKVIQ